MPLFRQVGRLLGLLLLLGPSLSGLPAVHATDGPSPLPGICSESDRFGVVVAGGIGDISEYDVEPLHAGWYHNFTMYLHPSHPAGMQYVETVRVSDDGPFADRACSSCPTWTNVRFVAQTNPGSLWIIGNEPDRQDYTHVDRYAQIYHEFYSFLKTEDPTSLVGVGGVVLPSPARIDYLDQILLSYQNQYTTTMPVDVWNIHHYLLREAEDYGAGIPPGVDPALGILYLISEHDMLDPHPTDPQKLGWKGHLLDFRRWMRDRGYRDRPLIITEYGILMPEFYDYDYERVRDFMLATFDHLLTATDADVGYPADGNRLVQAWAWYSLNDPAFEGFPSWNHLFDPDTGQITNLGLEYSAYTATLTDPFPGSVDLHPTALWHGPLTPAGGTQVTMTISAKVQNGGAEEAQNVVVRFERDGAPAGETTLPSVPAGASRMASVVWSNLPRGARYQVTVRVDPDALIVECNPHNNNLTAPLLVTDYAIYLPILLKSG